MKYYVIELQTANDGTAANLVYSYDAKADAEEKFHQIMSVAAKSAVHVHAAVMMTGEGFTLEHGYFVHPIPEPEETEE